MDRFFMMYYVYYILGDLIFVKDNVLFNRFKLNFYKLVMKDVNDVNCFKWKKKYLLIIKIKFYKFDGL